MFSIQHLPSLVHSPETMRLNYQWNNQLHIGTYIKKLTHNRFLLHHALFSDKLTSITNECIFYSSGIKTPPRNAITTLRNFHFYTFFCFEEFFIINFTIFIRLLSTNKLLTSFLFVDYLFIQILFNSSRIRWIFTDFL